MIKNYFIGIALLLPLYSFSQEHKNDTWADERDRIDLTPEQGQLPSIYLKDFLQLEYFEEDSALFIYSTTHKIIRVNSDEAILSHNRIYVPMYNVVKLVSLKARSISPSGDIQDLDEKNIKEIKDEDTGNAYRIFAIEGLEKGSEIEYMYTVKLNRRYFGREFLQETVPVYNSDFELICPEHLKFDIKGYNGFPQTKEEEKDGKRFYTAHIKYIPELDSEQYSAYTASRMRVEYKLAYNLNQGTNRLLSWEDATQRIYQIIYDVSDSESEAVDKFIQSIDLPDKKEDQIRSVENYVKNNIGVQEGVLSDLDDLTKVTTVNYTNTTGIVRLFAAIFKKLDIKHEIVLTNGRDETGFDPQFENWNNLADYLFYFPDYKSFLSPDKPEYRYGMVPYYLTDNKGLFISTFKLGDIETANGRIDYIPTLSADQDFDKMEINVSFDKDLSAVNIDFKRTMGGYNALFIQPYYPYVPEEQRQAFLKEFVRGSAEDAKFNSLDVDNVEPNLSPLNSPFIVKANFTTSAYVEKAGPKILFKIGELIGEQVEMYQDKNRRLDMENDYLRKYMRYINFTIPDGYKIKNPDDINMKVLSSQEDPAFGFTSSYTIEGNVLKLYCEEYYHKLRYPADKFEEFRKVINAAADFNKIVLVIEKI